MTVLCEISFFFQILSQLNNALVEALTTLNFSNLFILFGKERFCIMNFSSLSFLCYM